MTGNVPQTPTPAQPQSGQGSVFYVGADFDQDARPHLDGFGWADFIMRYSKNLSMAEKTAIENSGARVGLIFEVGQQNSLRGQAGGRADADSFIAWTQRVGLRPAAKSAVFVTADFDPTPQEVPTCVEYWLAFSNVILPDGWQIGGYANGNLQKALIQQFHDRLYYPWSVGAKGWSGTRAFDLTSQWILNQGPTLPVEGGSWPASHQLAIGDTFLDPQEWPDAGIQYDPDIATTLDWAL